MQVFCIVFLIKEKAPEWCAFNGFDFLVVVFPPYVQLFYAISTCCLVIPRLDNRWTEHLLSFIYWKYIKLLEHLSIAIHYRLLH